MGYGDVCIGHMLLVVVGDSWWLELVDLMYDAVM